MSIRGITLSLAALCLFHANAWAADEKSNTFEQLGIQKFAGATLVNSIDSAFNEYTLPRKTGTASGHVIRMAYISHNAASPFEIAQNYAQSLTANGFASIHKKDSTTAFDIMVGFCGINKAIPICGDKEHFGDASAARWEIFKKTLPDGDVNVILLPIRIEGNLTWEPKGTVNTLTPAKLKATQQLKTGDHIIFVDVIAPKYLDNKMVKEDAGFLEKSLAEKGKVDLYGLYFDFDKSDLKPESGPVLESIASLLKSHPEMKLQIIGHTDNTGTPGHNAKLSTDRADAVAKALATQYSVAAQRLQPSGKGAASPVESNETEQGRSKNRRVELVQVK